MADDEVVYAVRTIDETTEPTREMSGSYDALIAKLTELNQSADVTNQYLGALTEQTQETAATNENASLSMSDLNQGLEGLSKGLGYIQQAYGATIEKSMAYAESVRDLMAITGESAQATSDLIQVADDYQISADDLTASMRVLTKNGLVPNKETIISLAEQYQAIQDPLAKNEFLIKNLGRASTGYTNLLSQNTDELEDSFDAQSKNLEFGEKQLAQAEQLRLSQDQLNDTIEYLKLNIGSQLTPVLTNWLTIVSNANNWQTKWAENIQRTNGLAIIPAISWMLDYSDANNANAAALEENTKAATDNAAAQQLTAEQTKANDEAAKALSETYTTILSLTQSLESQVDTYNESMANIAATEADLVAKREATPAWDTQKIADYNAKLDELPAKAAEVEAKYAESMAKLAYDNLITKLSVDGLTDAEFNQAQQVGVSLGIFTQSSADRAIALNNLTSALAAGKITQGEFDQAVKDGSFKIEESTGKIAEGYDTISRTVKEKVDAAVQSNDDLSRKVEGTQDAVAVSIGESKKSWDGLTTNVQENVSSLSGYIDQYIAKLDTIPATKTTQLIVDDTTADGSAGADNLQSGFGGAGRTIVYNIENAYIGAGHELEMLVS